MKHECCPCCCAPAQIVLVVTPSTPPRGLEIKGATGWEVDDGLLHVTGPGGVLATFREWSRVAKKSAE